MKFAAKAVNFVTIYLRPMGPHSVPRCGLKFDAIASNFRQFPWRAGPAILRLAAQDRELSTCLHRHGVKRMMFYIPLLPYFVCP